MSILYSDVVGGVASVSLAVPTVKDQFYRFISAKDELNAKGAPWPELWDAASRAWESRRNAYDGVDSLLTLAGAGGLAISFLMKLCGA